MQTGIIYLITNTVNGKVYVGQTTSKLKYRWNKHQTDMASGSTLLFHKAIRNYSPAQFTQKILETLPEPELNDAEIKWIARYDSFRDRTKGYNLTEGGGGIRGMHHSEETKRKLSEAHSGEKHHAFGSKWSEEARSNHIASAPRGEDHTFFGKKLPEETRKKMSEAKKGTVPTQATRDAVSKFHKGRKRSPETRARLSASLRESNRLNPRKPHSEETKAKMRAVQSARRTAESADGIVRTPISGADHPMFGKEHSQETRDKMKAAKASVESRAEISERKKAWWTNNPELAEVAKKRMSESGKNRKPISDETRAKLVASQKARWTRIKEAQAV